MLFRVLSLLVLAVAFALPAWAKPTVSSAISPEGWRVHTIKFDSTTDDSEPFGLGPSCSVRVVTYGGSNSVSLYQVPTKTTAAASGSLIGTYSSVSTTADTFLPGQGLAKAVSASGSDGTVMEVWCSNTDVAGGGGGGSAPGISGNLATLETLQWIWGLERVPFPETIDPPPGGAAWTDYYFSAESTGLWPTGDDSNDGLTPETAKRTLVAAKSVCFGGAYRRCNFDTDDWTNTATGNGGLGASDAAFGNIENGDITSTGCPDASNVRGVLEQPCYWMRSVPGGRAHFDATDSTSTEPLLDFRPTTKRSHLLIEAIDLTGDSATANEGPAVDSHEAGIVTVVASELVNNADSSTGTNNIATAHDVSVTHLYGNVNLSYTGDNSGGASAAFGANVSGNVALHTAGSITGCSDNTLCSPFIMEPGTGTPTDTAEAGVTATGAFVSGARIIAGGASSRGLRIDPGVGNSSGTLNVYFVSTSHEGGAYVSRTDVDPIPDGTSTNIRMIYPTFLSPAGGSRFGFQMYSDYTGDSTYSYHFAGSIIEYQAVGSSRPFIYFTPGDDWFDTSSTFKMVDTVYQRYGTQFRINASGGNCIDPTPALLLDCVNNDRSRTVPIEISNSIEISEDVDSTATAGGATTLTDSSQSWTTNEWDGAIVTIDGGTGDGQSRRVASNTATALTVDTAWGTNPDATSTYVVERFTSAVGFGHCNTLDDGECEDAATSTASADYSIPSLPLRLQIPSFIAGKRLTGFKGEPAVYNNLGRQGAIWASPL